MPDPTRDETPPRLLLSTSAIRALESRGLAATPAGTLMSRAADAIAQACVVLLRRLPARTPVLALAGPGNNGGDALLAALRLADRGFAVHGLALTLAPPTASDACAVHALWAARGLPLAAPDTLGALLKDAPLVIDGLFGIGLARPLPPDAIAIVERLARARVTVVAVDVPSGLDADTGSVVGGPGAAAVRADVTVTMIADKPGLHTGAGCDHAGRVLVADLGLPEIGIAPAPGTDSSACGGEAPARDAVGCLVDESAVRRLLPPRPRNAHKGRYGDVLVIAGAPAMRGASLLAMLGAQAVGAGRIHLVGDAAVATDPREPELMTRRIDRAATEPERRLGPAHAIVAGCGFGRPDAAGRRTLEAALRHPAALVLDADGLNAIATDAGLRAALRERAARGRPSVLTPHPLEAARLLGTDAAEVQRDRLAAASRLAAESGACVVLKGAGTVVALPDGRWSMNASGGPILSVAGTGDVLAGAIGGLLAGGLAPVDAATLGVWLHGAAGDALAAEPQWRGSIGLPASRLRDAIRARINRLAGDRS
jgi:hydroxyethylthiazole kinase-like uncharacterized protein yjeF